MAVDAALGTTASTDSVEQAKAIANNAAQSAANATAAANAATKAAEDATKAAQNASASAASAASTATVASANATSAKNTADDTAKAFAAAKPILLWNGVVKPGNTITVPGIQNWKMVLVGLSASTSDGAKSEFLAPGTINLDVQANQMRGGGTWGNASDEIRLHGYAATITDDQVTFTSNVYVTIGGSQTPANWSAARNIMSIYGLVKA